MGEPWMWAIAVLGVAGLLGTLLGGITRRMLSKEAVPEPLREAAPVLGGFAFWVVIAFGLVAALGIVDPDSLSDMPKDLIAFLPKVFSAGLIVIVANVAGQFAAHAVSKGMSGASGQMGQRVPALLRVAIVGAAAVVAASQLGVNTTIINLAAAALLFSIGAAFTLLVGLGGREVAGQLAAGRALRGNLQVGSLVQAAQVSGRIVAVHPVSVEIETGEGQRLLVPYARLLDDVVRVTRSADDQQVR